MILSYRNAISGDGKLQYVKATVTTDHPASSYGQPVIVLEDGTPLDLASWVLLNYKIEEATKQERLDTIAILSRVGLWLG